MKPIIHVTVPGSPDDPWDDLPQLDGVEWRTSLGMLDEVIAEFEDDAGRDSADG